ncbi:MAG: heme-binding protein [Kofleriaceae bacterium]
MTKIKVRKLAYYAGMVVIPAGIGAFSARAKRSTLFGSVAGGLTALAMLGVRWQLARLFTDQPGYDVEERIGRLEIRRYAPQVTAHTQVETEDYDAAVQQGFRRLAGYIFGDNFNGEKLAMAAPVMTSATASEKLAMTAPVITESEGRGYKMSFVMPAGRAVDSLPLPNDTAIELDEVPERRVAVLRFTGTRRGAQIEQREQELMQMVKDAGLQPLSTPMFAGFDPPVTLPFLRRNEVWVEIAPHS